MYYFQAMAFNVDLKMIKETYQQMGDEELQQFAVEDGRKLSAGAYLLLKDELHRRNIGAGIINAIDHDIILKYSLRQQQFEEDISDNLYVSALQYALAEKKEGKTQYDIYAGLVARGLSEPYANYMINRLDEWAAILHKDAVLNLQTGAGLLVLGAVALYVAININSFQVAAAFLCLSGIIKMISAGNHKKKYKKIISNIKLESKSALPD